MAYVVQEQIGRKVQLPTPMRIEEIVMRSNDAYPDLPPVFNCRPLLASITVSACAANYARGMSSCIACPVGKVNASETTPKTMRAEPGKPFYSNRPVTSCIRCGRTGRDQHSARFVGRMRMVHRVALWLPDSVDALSVDVSCHNRQKEVIAGRNSKGAKPVRNAILREAMASYRVGKKLYKDIDIGMRASVNEVRRLLARGYPDAEVKLIEVTFDGAAADLNSTDDPLYLPTTPKTKVNDAKKASTAAKPLPAASDCEAFSDDDSHQLSPSWLQVFGDPWKQRKQPLPPLTEEEDEAYRASFDEPAIDPESVAGQFGLSDADGVRDFIDWLTDGWPVAPFAPVADAIAPVEAAQPVTDDSEWAGVTIRDGRGVEYDIAKAAAQFEVAPEKIASEFGIPSNADIVFAGKTLGDWAAIKGESVAVMAARMAETGSPFEGKRAAIQPPPARAHVEAFPEVAEPVSEAAGPVADDLQKLEVLSDALRTAEPISDEVESAWEGCFVMRGEKKVFVTTYARKHGMTDEAAAAALGFEIADEEEPAPEPVAEPAEQPVSAPKQPAKHPTGKQLRKAEKAARRAERQQQQQQQQQAAKHMPATKAKATAIASRALAIFDSMSAAAR